MRGVAYKKGADGPHITWDGKLYPSSQLLRPFNKHRLVRNISLLEIESESRKIEGAAFTDSGAIGVNTGAFTGRTPRDRWLVCREPSKSRVDWGPRNQAISPDSFDEVVRGVVDFLKVRTVYVFDGFVGSVNPPIRLRVYVTSPVQLQFCRCLFKTHEQLGVEDRGYDDFEPDIVIFVASEHKVPETTWPLLGLNSSTCVGFDFERGLGVVAGTAYNGEIKKLVFTALNYYYPMNGHLSMHCAATRSLVGGKSCPVALYFGLSGTGKTTLSNDPKRELIGDDETCWDDEGIFNIEGGCYAKVIRLSRSEEPMIYDALRKGAVLENVVIDGETWKPDYADSSITENTRAAYSLTHVPHVPPRELNPHPSAILFLVCDTFGILPPVSKLSRGAAMYWFIAGFSAKVAGTELGSEGVPTPTFSPMFGGPFMPLHPRLYADLLEKKLDERPDIEVWLVNTGWTGGPPGVGARLPISITRKCVEACLTGMPEAKFHRDPIFNVDVPESLNGVPSDVLNPVQTWRSREEYIASSEKLAALFHENWKKEGYPEELAKYGPVVRDTSE